MQKINYSNIMAKYNNRCFLILSRSFVLAIIALIVLSCSVPLKCDLYNNTSNSISITQIDLDGLEMNFTLDAGASILLSGWALHNYKIAFKDSLWAYDPPAPSQDYVEITGSGPWIKPLVHAQINSDGSIYIVPKGQRPPIKIFTKQPEGYPLFPR